MTDFAVKVTVRNARILRAMKAQGFNTQADLARFIGTEPGRIGELLSFKKKPIANGDWSSLAMDISSALRTEPEHLWPHHMRDLLQHTYPHQHTQQHALTQTPQRSLHAGRT